VASISFVVFDSRFDPFLTNGNILKASFMPFPTEEKKTMNIAINNNTKIIATIKEKKFSLFRTQVTFYGKYFPIIRLY